MGNPLRKENLGGNMTGGHGALPYFNAFMIPFMKGKPKEKFPEPPPMPAELKRGSNCANAKSRKNSKKLTKPAEQLGINFNTGTKNQKSRATRR